MREVIIVNEPATKLIVFILWLILFVWHVLSDVEVTSSS